ncbi:MAG: CHAT domain-containing protein [Magnetococcus sp. YQC-5]
MGWINIGFAEPVIVHPAFDFAPSITRDGQKLAFVSTRSDNRDIWLLDLAPGAAPVPRQLTNHPAADEAPALHPDGSRLLYLSHATDPRGDIYLLDLTTNETKQLTNLSHGETTPVWCQDNSFLYTRLATAKEPQAVIHRTLNPQQETLLLTGASSCTCGPKDWVVCSKEGKLLALPLSQPTHITTLTHGPALDREPTFSDPTSDNNRLFFTRFANDDDNRSTLWMARFEPNKGLVDLYQLTPDGGSLQHPSPSQEQLYYADIQDGAIHRVDLTHFLELYADPHRARTEAATRFAEGKHPLGLMILANLSANPAPIPLPERLNFDLEYVEHLQEAGLFSLARRILQPHANTPGPNGAMAAILALALPIHESANRVSVDELSTLVQNGVRSILALGKRWQHEEPVLAMARIEASRLLLLTKNTLAALDQLSSLENLKHREWNAKALFARGKVYRILKDETSLKRVFMQVIRAMGEKNRWGLLAIAQVISVTEQGKTYPLNTVALRHAIQDHPDLKHLRAATLLRIAQIDQDHGEEQKTIATLAEIPDNDPDLLPERIKSLWWKAERLTRLEQFSQAATAYETLSKLPGLSSADQTRATEQMTRQRVQAATKQRDLGDPKAAAKSLAQILTEHPTSVEAHREYIATKALLGKTSELLTQYETLVAQHPHDPTLLYAHALVLTYLEPPDLSRIIELLTKVVEQRPNQPYFHQTLAWAHEQFERLHPDQRGHLEQAAQAYQTALRLTDTLAAPHMQANLLLNLGNVFFAMNNHGEAYRYFHRWTELKRPLANPLDNALLHRKLAESAFKTDRTRESTTLYRKVLDLLPDDQTLLKLAVQERLALAYQTLGEHARAATYFAQVLEGNLALNKTENLALLQRNIGINLYQAALPAPGDPKIPIDRAALQEALASYLKSLDYLDLYGKQEKMASKGLFGMVFSFGENASQFAMGFDRQGEEKLLFGFVSTAYEGLEEPTVALEFLHKKLALIPDPLSTDVAVMTERAVLYNRIGLLHFRLGQRALALENTLASLALTEKLRSNYGHRANLYNLSKIAVEIIQAKEPLDPTPIAYLADQLQAQDWATPSPKSAFYTLANTAFALVHLPEIPLKTVRGTPVDAPTGLSHLYELKTRSDSLYKRAEALLLPGKEFSSQERLTHLIHIKLNRIVIAHAAQKPEAAARLTAEVEQLAHSGWSESGWMLPLLQAEATQDPKQQEKLLQQALDSTLMLPAPVVPRGHGRIQAPFLDQLALLYTDLLVTRGALEQAFAVSEQLTMRRVSLLLHDQLGRDFFLQGLGDEREEITALLQDLETSLAKNTKEPSLTLTAPWKKALTDLYATHPRAVPWFQPFDPTSLPQRVVSPRRPFLKLVPGAKTRHLFLATGQEILHATFTPQGEIQANPHFMDVISKAEILMLAAQDPVLHQWVKKKRATLPVSHIQTLYDLIPAHPRQGLFYSRLALIPPARLDLGGIPAEVPLQQIALTEDATGNLAQLAHVHLLMVGMPLSEFAVPVREKNRVIEKIPLEKIEVAEGHTAVLATGPEWPDTDLPNLATAVLHSGFSHVILAPGTLPVTQVEKVTRRYLMHLADTPALLALERAWKESGENQPNPFMFYGAVGLDQATLRQKATELYEEELAAAVTLQQANDPVAALRRVENGLGLMKRANRMEQFTQLSQFAVDALFKQGEYARAITHQERLLAFIGDPGDPLARAQALYTLGILYSRLEQFEPAITHLEAAIKIWTQTKVTEKLAEGVTTLGVVKENRGAYADALAAFVNSFELYQKQNNKPAMAEHYLRMGRIYHLRLARSVTAREQFEKALALYQELRDPEGQAKAHLDIGLSLDATGQFAEADRHYQTAKQLGAKQDSPFLMATATLYLANTAWYQGEYQSAFQGLLEAQELNKQAKDPQLEIMIANTRGLVFWTLNEHDKALLHLHKAIDSATKEKIPSELASSLNNKGQVLRQMGQLEEALSLFQQAQAIDSEIKSRWGLGHDHRNIGIVLMQMGKLKAAETEFLQAESLSAEIADPVNQAKTLLELGRVNQKLERPEQSADYFQRASKLAKHHGIKEVLWRALAGQAMLSRKQNHNEAALKAYVEAIQVVEGMRATLKIDALRNSFQEDKQELYREIILLLADMGRERQAFDYLERFRSRNFIDLLSNQKIALHKKEDEAALSRVNGLFQDLETLAREIAAQKKPEAQMLKRYREQQAAAEEAQLELQQRNPELSGFVSVNPIQLDPFEKLLEPGVGVLAYLLTEKELLIWLTRAQGTLFKRVAVTEKEMTATIRQYRDLMQNMEPVSVVMHQLYQWLIQPMAEQTQSLKHLGIIPHEALHFLAFAALEGPDGVLVERHPIFYAPSASAMKYAFDKRHKEKKTRVLAVGNPDLGDIHFDLPLAEFEADSIRWSFPEGDALKGKKATKEWILQNISKYGIIHIAAHGDFQNINPLFSSLWLATSQSKGKNQEAGHLTVKEIFSLELNADLVTLSACQTGLGQLRGSEMIGLNRAFLYAGTHSLISSLWRVDDLSTAVLMKHFYRHYRNMNKAESLRQAQLMVKQNFPHPANWAGFNLLGDYQ